MNAPRNPAPRAPKTKHARNQAGRTRQMRLPIAAARTWGGARKGAGRKPRGRPSMPHVTRPKVDPRFPVQVTIRATPGLPSLRSPRVFGALRRAIARASVDRFRVIHFSIQQDHGHFIVEGDEARRARGGVHGLAIRLALAVNRALGRKGKVVGDRYHARPLTTPRQMRTSMVYVLLNFRKHLRAPACIDPRSSGQHFSGWQATPVVTDVAPATVEPGTWMARVGWRRAGGPLRVDEHPAATPRPPNLNARMLRRAGVPTPSSSVPLRPPSNRAGSCRRPQRVRGSAQKGISTLSGSTRSRRRSASRLRAWPCSRSSSETTPSSRRPVRAPRPGSASGQCRPCVVPTTRNGSSGKATTGANRRIRPDARRDRSWPARRAGAGRSGSRRRPGGRPRPRRDRVAAARPAGRPGPAPPASPSARRRAAPPGWSASPRARTGSPADRWRTRG